jgi:hypothetical protein
VYTNTQMHSQNASLFNFVSVFNEPISPDDFFVVPLPALPR